MTMETMETLPSRVESPEAWHPDGAHGLHGHFGAAPARFGTMVSPPWYDMPDMIKNGGDTVVEPVDMAGDTMNISHSLEYLVKHGSWCWMTLNAAK